MQPLALKIDVDTYEGMRTGVPRILRVLGEKGILASFFISFGPDRSGLAALQLLRPRFLLKMIRTNAPAMYGLKTAFYGTILPAPMIGSSFADLLLQIREMGHEVACHAWDHRLWQDWLGFMTTSGIQRWFENMVDSYTGILGERPSAFGAPGWRIDRRALEQVARLGLSYLSCTRADRPFVFMENGMLEIPSNLPCIEEVGTSRVIQELDRRKDSGLFQVLPVHAEVEGGMYLDDFRRIIDTASRCEYRFVRLCEIESSLDRDNIEIRGLKEALLPGRAFKCAV